METSLANNWWVLALRGGFAVAFGVLAFFWSDMSWAAIVALFAGYAFADGVLALWAAASVPIGSRTWWSLTWEGLAGVAAGVLVMVLPGVTSSVLLYFIALRALASGVSEIAASDRFGKEGAAVLGLTGVLSTLFGLTAMFAPGVGALAAAGFIAVYALVFGVLQFVVAIRLKSVHSALTTRIGTIA